MWRLSKNTSNNNVQNNNIFRNEENSQIPKALKNNDKDDWHKIIDEERQNKNF